MRFHKITHFDTSNGIGVREVLWVSGCEHHCKNCHNPETWDRFSGKEFTNKDFNNLIKNLDKDYIDGITFSGGDPLAPYNIATVTLIAKYIKENFPSKTIWCYTGYSWEEVNDLEIMKYINVLVDGEFKEELKNITLLFKGSENQRVINVDKTRETGEICILI